MAEQTLTVSRRLYLPKSTPSIDFKYGLYESIDDALEKLGEDGLDCICEGLTFGVKEGDNKIVDYWFNGGTDREHIELKSIVAMSNEEIDEVIKEVFREELTEQEKERENV